MPKKEIDYANTIIYKISCKNTSIKDLYVGHTTNFVQKKYAHKNICTNNKSPNHYAKLYTVIRENGGWNNWKMELISTHICKNHNDAKKLEHECILSLGATLNDTEFLPVNFTIESTETQHDISSEIDIAKNVIQKNTYFCEKCDYKCCLKQHMDQHCLSKRHKNNSINPVENSVNIVEKSVNDTEKQKFVCECGLSYRERSGLWRHRQKCNKVNVTNNSIISKEYELRPPELMSLITELVKSHHGIQDSILELCKNGTHNTINTTNMLNSNNKTFNLNMFLNETCKDAMNITEFVDSIKLQLSDLENVGEMGYVKGISNIIVKNLNALDITRRPVHCADKKRDILYVKDDNKWEKESGENEKLRKMIKRVAFKNYKQIAQFKAKHPDCNKSESKYSDKYNKIIVESMGGEGDNEKENEYKIIRNISKEVVIDKSLI